LGFRAFARGAQANGLGSLLTLGLPLAAWGLLRLGSPELAALTPPGAVYVPLTHPLGVLTLAGSVLAGAAALAVARGALADCDRSLRLWYDRNCGRKVID
jgi:hypothetical protein